MSLGEKAVLKCTSDYAYGPEGAGGVIPPNAGEWPGLVAAGHEISLCLRDFPSMYICRAEECSCSVGCCERDRERRAKAAKSYNCLCRCYILLYRPLCGELLRLCGRLVVCAVRIFEETASVPLRRYFSSFFLVVGEAADRPLGPSHMIKEVEVRRRKGG